MTSKRSPQPRFAVAALTLTSALVLTACGSGGDPDAGGTGGSSERAPLLTIGQIGDVTSWNPGEAHVGHQLLPYQPVYDTLIMREPDGELSPMLATEWEWDDERTTLTLELRDDVTFSDGEPFNAEAVIANFENFVATGGRQAVQLTQYESATAVDDDTLEVSLAAPDPAFEYYMSQAAGLMASPAALESGTIDTTPIGTGPYVYDAGRSVRDNQITYTAREDYWNPELQKYDEIELRILDELSARVNAGVSGQVDFTTMDARSADQAEGAGLTIVPDYQVDWTGMSLLDREGVLTEALADVRVRQAMNYAIDRETLLEQLQLDRGSVTRQVFGPESGAYVEELEESYPYDPELARELMEEAGYADGFSIETPVNPSFSTQITAMAQQLSEIGITLEQVAVPPANYVADVNAGQYSVFNFNLSQGEAWIAINQLISPSATYNPFGVTTPELEQLIEIVRLGGDDSAAAAEEINRYVTEEAWFLPLYRIDQIAVYNSETVEVEPQVQSAAPSIYNFSPAS